MSCGKIATNHRWSFVGTNETEGAFVLIVGNSKDDFCREFAVTNLKSTLSDVSCPPIRLTERGGREEGVGANLSPLLVQNLYGHGG